MALFIIGVFVGACAAVAVFGFMFVAAEDRETKRAEMEKQKRGWYTEDD